MDFTMLDNEDVSTYHSRFQNLVNRMNSHKMDMEHLDQGLTFVKGADARIDGKEIARVEWIRVMI